MTRSTLSESQEGACELIVADQRDSRVAAFIGDELQWEWRPQRSECWGLPSEARVRHVEHLGGQVLLVADSLGYVGVVDADGDEVWATDVGRGANPHAIEMLPGGLIAVAASDGGWVRTYSTRGPAVCAEVQLQGAHGLYGGSSAGLWALGDHELVLLSVDGGVMTPVHTAPLPSGGGHDLAAAYGAPGRLWVSTRSHVYLYDPDADRWHLAEPEVDHGDVKSVGDHPRTGQVLMTWAEEMWWTDTLRMVAPDRTIRLPGARVYKARWSVAERR